MMTPRVLSRKLKDSAPLLAWAKRSGYTRFTVQAIVAMQQQYTGKNGNPSPSFKHMCALVESLESGEWHWVIQGPRHKSASWSWSGKASFEKVEGHVMQVGRANDGSFRILM